MQLQSWLSATVITFFGTDGVYSSTLLGALVHADLGPNLVVVGEGAPDASKRARVSFFPHAPSLFDRVFLAIRRAWDLGSRDGELAAAAHAFGADVVVTTDPNATRARARIHAAAPDLFVVAGFPRLLHPNVLRLSKKGGLNVHPGRLPEERGPAPLFWALREGRTDLWVTIHMLDEGEDTGDVVATGAFCIVPGTAGRDVFRRAAEAAAPLLVRSVRSLLAGDIVRVRQNSQGARRCPRPKFEDGRIDVNRSAQTVFTFVRGMGTSHSLFVEIAQDRFFIADATSYDDALTMPHEYMLVGDRLVLRCQPGIVELMLKPEGALFSAEYLEEHGPTEESPRGDASTQGAVENPGPTDRRA